MRDVIAINKHIWEKLWEQLQSTWGFLMMVALIALDFLDKQLGGFTFFTTMLIRLQLIDVVLGTVAALCGRGKHQKTFRSKNGIWGIHGKAFVWFWIWGAHQLDLLWGLNLRDLLVKAYCTFEVGSIAEIWVAMKWVGYGAIEKVLMSRISFLKRWTMAQICVYDEYDSERCSKCENRDFCTKKRKGENS